MNAHTRSLVEGHHTAIPMHALASDQTTGSDPVALLSALKAQHQQIETLCVQASELESVQTADGGNMFDALHKTVIEPLTGHLDEQRRALANAKCNTASDFAAKVIATLGIDRDCSPDEYAVTAILNDAEGFLGAETIAESRIVTMTREYLELYRHDVAHYENVGEAVEQSGADYVAPNETKIGWLQQFIFEAAPTSPIDMLCKIVVTSWISDVENDAAKLNGKSPAYQEDKHTHSINAAIVWLESKLNGACEGTQGQAQDFGYTVADVSPCDLSFDPLISLPDANKRFSEVWTEIEQLARHNNAAAGLCHQKTALEAEAGRLESIIADTPARDFASIAAKADFLSLEMNLDSSFDDDNQANKRALVSLLADIKRLAAQNA